ncbi:serine threonine phosphatase alpha [Cryptosporidium sp. chipmunk genotype I]|uniref:serine threonine phosphatase alpha n=1 Tax=Cryptosporidium sp. chipmunk genotype I TaxID=1280935 RepID=UPI00351A91CA|nr:serine threonine phosphatase alpha [Cryptosporidium sp. chipmunk genotype I]
MAQKEQMFGDIPTARFGHSTTFVGNSKVVLFGGAIGDSGRYTITADTYILDFSAGFQWKKITADNPPSARAAHASACVDLMQLVIYGGATGGGSLSSDELYLLDLRKDPHYGWMSVPICGGRTPGRRYGHTMVYSKPNLIVFGGNDGQRTLNDVWFMNVEESPFVWTQVLFDRDERIPCPRVYHSAALCMEGPAAGMTVIHGGRASDSRCLRDTWGLRQHRDGRWDWIEAPCRKGGPPAQRFQHVVLFVGSKMLALGGRGDDVSKVLPSMLYDTENCEWRDLPGIERFRHSAWTIKSTLFSFAGFDHKTQTQPTVDLLSMDCSAEPNFYNEKERSIRRKSLVGVPYNTIGAQPKDQIAVGSVGNFNSSTSSSINEEPGSSTSNEQNTEEEHNTSKSNDVPFTDVERAIARANIQLQNDSKRYIPKMEYKTTAGLIGLTPAVTKVSSRVHVTVDSMSNDFSTLVQKVSIDQLGEEGRKIDKVAAKHALADSPWMLTPSSMGVPGTGLIEKCLKLFLHPTITPVELSARFNHMAAFSLTWPEVIQLCEMVFSIVKQEDMVLKLRTPVKVYGDIHGQYYDLMRLFHNYKAPISEELEDIFEAKGDIDSTDYLFLGDYVDRGSHSLETICLLFALKIRYPRQIHLIRGNHEDPIVNSLYGFKDECRRRLREDTDDPESCWNWFNRVFEYLPVGAIIEDRILCIHGGIGGSIHKVEQIKEIQRPLRPSQTPQTEYEQRILDLLWSDPTDNDSLEGIVPNDTRDPDGCGFIVKFGPDRVIQFLCENNLDLIIRAHECVQDGFERFAGGKLITLFSATDYCGKHQNAGALLFIKRDLTVVPKILLPSASKDPRMILTSSNYWDQDILSERPPTPPRSATYFDKINSEFTEIPT